VEDYRFETWRVPRFLNNRLIEGDEVVSLTAVALYLLPPMEDSCYSFVLEAKSTPGP
jgi:hypothetical protein